MTPIDSTFAEYADKTFNDFLNAARAQGIETALTRTDFIVNAVEVGVLAQLNDDDKLLVRRFCNVLRANLKSDKAKFRVLYQAELAMADDVLTLPAQH